jgi:hypothetical protein
MSLWVDETRPHMEGFQAFYEEEIADWLQSQEGRRHKAVIQAVVVSALTLPPLLYFWGTFFGFESDWSFLGLLLAILICETAAFYRYLDLSSDVKTFLIGKITGFFGLDYRASPGHMGIAPYAECGLVPDYSAAKFEDMFSGEHDGVKLALVECRLTRGHGRNRKEVFNGLLYTFEFNKPFEGRTVVLEDKGAIGNWRRERKTSFERVRLEDARFENLFEVYATDQVEARYLLTPAFLERIVALSGLGPITGVQLGFTDNLLLIAVTKKGDWFETGQMMTKQVNHADRISKMAEQIGFVFDVVDALNLTLKTRV